MIIEPGTICETDFGAPAYVAGVSVSGMAWGIRRKGKTTRVLPFTLPASALRPPSAFSILWMRAHLESLMSHQRPAPEPSPILLNEGAGA